MKTCADYIEDAKRALGNARMSDRELGERLGKGYSQPAIAQAKTGKMTDPIALDLAEIIGVEGGAVLWTARTERERDPRVRTALINWSKTVASMDWTTAQRDGVRGSVGAGFKTVAALVIAAGATALPAQNAEAHGANAAGSSVCYVNRRRSWLGRFAAFLSPPSGRFTLPA